jgi:hypothetical protein
MILSNRSLTQNTDRFVLANIPYLFLCEHLICKVIQHHFRFAAAFPSSAHTYRLLIFKELFLLRTLLALRFLSRRAMRHTVLRIVLFASSREMRLCGVSEFASTTLFSAYPAHPALPHLPLTPAFQREPNYIKCSGTLASVCRGRLLLFFRRQQDADY